MNKPQLKANSHSLTAKFIHWGFIAVFVYALTKQVDDVEELEDFSLLQFEMAFASIFLILLVTRYIYMHSTLPTMLSTDTSNAIRLMARSAHLAMYISLSMIAVSGLMIGGLYWSGIKSGGAMDIALWLHEISVNASFFLIGLHILAAIYHRLENDGIWSSMVPFWKEDSDK